MKINAAPSSISDPRALGVLREVMGKAIQQGLIVELAKDLVRHPTSEIERHIAKLGALT